MRKIHVPRHFCKDTIVDDTRKSNPNNIQHWDLRIVKQDYLSPYSVGTHDTAVSTRRTDARTQTTASHCKNTSKK